MTASGESAINRPADRSWSGSSGRKMDSVTVRDATVASTFCAGNVVGVQREAMSLLLWKQVSTPPLGQTVRALSQRLEDLVRATDALDDYVRRNPLEESVSDACIKFLEDAEAALRFVAKAMVAFSSQRRRDAHLERVIGTLTTAIEAIQNVRWTLMVADGLQGPASSELYRSGSELVEASLAC